MGGGYQQEEVVIGLAFCLFHHTLEFYSTIDGGVV
jgi:hypothetical protein